MQPVPDAPRLCLKCQAHLGIPSPGHWSAPAYCEACLEAEERLERQVQLRQAFKTSRIPRAYQGFRLDRTVERDTGEDYLTFTRRVQGLETTLGVSEYNRHVVTTLQAWLASRGPQPWLWLRGPQGNGKSLLMACMGQHLLEQGAEVRFFTEQGLFNRLALEWQRGYRYAGTQQLVEECEVLLLDECNPSPHRVDPPKAWMVRALSGLIQARYNERRITIFASRHGLREYGSCWRFGAEAGEDAAISGRLFELCGGEELELLGWDWRTGRLYGEEGEETAERGLV